MIFWAVLMTLCSAFLRATVQLVYHTHMQQTRPPLGDEPRNCGVIRKLHRGVAVMDRGAVVSVEGVQQGTQHTGLGRARTEA
ncbi:hypothetical protein AOLI_G00258710 [Acnodon oligacanthus]